MKMIAVYEANFANAWKLTTYPESLPGKSGGGHNVARSNEVFPVPANCINEDGSPNLTKIEELFPAPSYEAKADG